MANELNFESLLSHLGEKTTTVSKGSYEFSELTMNDQRKILNISFNPIEIPAAISNIFNDYIKKSVKCSDITFTGDIMDNVTVDIKPFMIVQLRKLTLGDYYYDTDGKKYTMRDVEVSDLESKIEPIVIEFNEFILRLSVPSLSKDTFINNQLINELKSFKKKLSDEEYGKVADLYQMYELIKYITEIEFNGAVFDFEKSPINKKMKIINSLPQRVTNQISDYIESVKEKEQIALTATNDETNETIEMDMSSFFFTKTARQK